MEDLHAHAESSGKKRQNTFHIFCPTTHRQCRFDTTNSELIFRLIWCALFSVWACFAVSHPCAQMEWVGERDRCRWSELFAIILDNSADIPAQLAFFFAFRNLSKNRIALIIIIVVVKKKTEKCRPRRWVEKMNGFQLLYNKWTKRCAIRLCTHYVRWIIHY